MTVLLWIVAVAVLWCLASVAVAWAHHVHRRRVIDRAEEDAWAPLPRTRLDNGSRPQIPHDSDGGRP